MKSTKNQAGEWLQAEVTSTIHQTSPSEYVYESSYSLQVPQSFRHYLMDSFPLAPWSGKNSKVKASLVAPSNTAQLSKTQPLKGCMGASLTWLLQPGSCYLHKVSLDTLVILKILSNILEYKTHEKKVPFLFFFSSHFIPSSAIW